MVVVSVGIHSHVRPPLRPATSEITAAVGNILMNNSGLSAAAVSRRVHGKFGMKALMHTSVSWEMKEVFQNWKRFIVIILHTGEPYGI